MIETLAPRWRATVVRMRIGDVAKRCQTTRRALRLYEEHGLITSTRAVNGYREYDESVVKRVRNIRFLVEAGLTLTDIYSFLPCLDGDVAATRACPPRVEVVQRRIDQLDSRIAGLTETRDRLATMLSQAQSTLASATHPAPR
jgi:DNA-binding transcriptional MerR regulator